MYKLKYYVATIRDYYKYISSNKKIGNHLDGAIIFMLACDYNNVGDMLIKESQEMFLKERTNKRIVITIDSHDTYKYLRYIKKNATKNTTIVLTGGGDVDDKYTSLERARNFIIKKMSKKQCKIISFPQTIDYSNTKRGNFYLKKAQKAYRKNKQFVFFARERKSFAFAKKEFAGTKILMAPDIVFSRKTIINGAKRKGIGLLCRDDAEKKMPDSFKNILLKRAKKDFSSIEDGDMTVVNFNKKNIDEYIKAKILYVQSKQLIITDRLHGMILCYITNTPCIVFRNTNHKIVETYNNWLKNKQNFIILEKTTDFDKIDNDIKTLLSTKHIQKQSLRNNFKILEEEITNNN